MKLLHVHLAIAAINAASAARNAAPSISLDAKNDATTAGIGHKDTASAYGTSAADTTDSAKYTSDACKLCVDGQEKVAVSINTAKAKHIEAETAADVWGVQEEEVLKNQNDEISKKAEVDTADVAAKGATEEKTAIDEQVTTLQGKQATAKLAVDSTAATALKLKNEAEALAAKIVTAQALALKKKEAYTFAKGAAETLDGLATDAATASAKSCEGFDLTKIKELVQANAAAADKAADEKAADDKAADEKAAAEKAADEKATTAKEPCVLTDDAAANCANPLCVKDGKLVLGDDVTDIPENAFSRCKALTSVIAPKVTKIGKNALRSTSLTSVDAPKLTKIGKNAFSHTSLTSANFPEATEVGENAFAQCSSLTSANFPEATKIGENAFGSCSSLTSANFPEATEIGEYAFESCKALTSVDAPKLTKIGKQAFKGCDNLNPKPTVVRGILPNKPTQLHA